MKNLENKIALVIGGSRGIGAAIVSELVKQGATVAFTYQKAIETANALVAELVQDGGQVIALQADSAEPQAVVDAVSQVAGRFGRIDILINNAGIAINKDISEFTISEFDQIMAVNVRAVFTATQTVLLHMRDGGRIVNIGSCLATRVVGTGWGLYAMSKAALIGFTKALARDVGAKQITVNIVHPGPVDTDMNPAKGDHADAQRAKMAIPRYGEGKDIAGVVAYLVGPQGKYITGAGFDVDGGTNS